MSVPEHKLVVDYVNAHPVFKQALDDGLLADLERRWPRCDEGWPELYCCIVCPERANLATVELGLSFALRNTQGQRRSDILGRLRDTRSIGTVFELAAFGSLVLEFGDDHVVPYPDLGGRRRAEAKVETSGGPVWIEATVLGFSDADKEEIKLARARGGVAVTSVPGTGEGRVIQKVEEKFARYKAGAPNMLLLSQYSGMPLEAYGVEALEDHFAANGRKVPACRFAGVFYFNRFECLQWVPNPGCAAQYLISDGSRQAVERAFVRMRP